MQDKYVVSHNGFETAPMKAVEILSKLAKKEFQPVDYVFIEAKQDWVMLAEFQSHLEATEPKSAAIPEQPPALTPYPVLTDEKKDKLLKQTPKAKEVTPIALPEPLKTTPPKADVLPLKLKSPDTNPQIPKEPYSAPEGLVSKPVISAPVVQDPNKKSSSVSLKQGEALYSLSAEKAGQFVVQLKSKNSLEVGSQLEVKVKSGKPEKITWEGPGRKTVGETAVFQVFAKDQFDNLVKSYSGEMSLKWQGDVEAPGKIHFKSGIGEVQVTTTKAQTLGFEILANSELPNVHLPTQAQVQFEAGPAEKLILEGPTEVMAGEPVQVKVRAIDKYGNIAKLDTEVEVEVTTRTA